MIPTCTFDTAVAPQILMAFGFHVEPRTKVICDQQGQSVPAFDDEEAKVTIQQFAGVVRTKNGTRLVRSDISSLIELADYLDQPKKT